MLLYEITVECHYTRKDSSGEIFDYSSRAILALMFIILKIHNYIFGISQLITLFAR